MGYSFVYNSGSYEEEKPFEKLHLEFGLFFDGTLNNKEHTALRLKVLNIDDLIIYPSDSEKTVRWKEQELAKRRERIHQGGLSKEDKDAFEIKIKKDYYEKKRVVPTEKEVRQILQDIINKDVKDYERADKRDWLDKQGVDNSFMNDYTNVARLYMSCDEAYAIYIEGIGTLDRQKDVDAGFQYGSGTSGIRAKVRMGCKELAQKIIKAKREKTRKTTSLSVTVDVFGFSRGATAARNFLYEVNSTHKRKKDIVIKKQTKKVLDKDLINPYSPNDDSVYTTKEVFTGFYIDKDNVIVNMDYIENDHMPKYGYLGYYLLENGFSKEELQNMTLSIRFLGIYDTVSSYEDVGDLNALSKIDHGIKHTRKNYFKDDVEQLQLNNLGKFQQAVHFTAMDEHRENFALTKLQPQESNCNYIEKTFPGVHCDIGGAYETGTEIVDEIEVCPVIISLFSSELEDLKSKLISDCWYMESQLEIKIELQRDEERVAKHLEFFKKKYDHFLKIIGGITGANLIRYKKLRGVRFLWKEYSYIPLHFMESYFLSNLSDNCEKIFSMTTIDEYSIKSHPKLVQAKEWLEKYVFGNGEKWSFIPNVEEIIKGKIIKLKGKKPLREATKDRLEERRYKVMLDNKHQYTELIKVLNQEKELRDRVINENPIIANHFILETLRTYYLHWSANRDWFGMDPTSDRIRKEY